MIDRVLKAVLLFGVAGWIVGFSMLVVAAVGVTNGNESTTIPAAYLHLLYLLCAVFGAAAAWGATRVEMLK